MTQEIIDVTWNEYGVKCELAPVGVDLDHFYPTRKITAIKRAGVIGNPYTSLLLANFAYNFIFSNACRVMGIDLNPWVISSNLFIFMLIHQDQLFVEIPLDPYT